MLLNSFSEGCWGHILPYLGGIHLALHSKISLVGLRETYGILDIEPKLAMCNCKYPTCCTFALAPIYYFFFFFGWEYTLGNCTLLNSSGSTGGPYAVARFKAGLDACKSSALILESSLQPSLLLSHAVVLVCSSTYSWEHALMFCLHIF